MYLCGLYHSNDAFVEDAFNDAFIVRKTLYIGSDSVLMSTINS